MNLRIIAPPASEPVTLQEALDQCHANVGEEDSWFMGRIMAGRIKAEERLRRALITQTWEFSFDKFPLDTVRLPRAPLQTVISIKYYDQKNVETVADLNDFVVDTDSQPGRIVPVDRWPDTELRKLNSVKIQYVAGYGATGADVPGPIKDAILFYVSHVCNNRAGEAPLPNTFFDLLEPYRMHI